MIEKAEQNGITPALMTTEQAAVYLGTTPGMLTLSRHTGELYHGVPSPRYVKLGQKTVRYLRRDLDEWVEEKCAGADRS